MERIDLNTWPRREAYRHFSGIDWPFYSLTFPVDVGGVRAVSRARGLSFYHLMIWLCTKAVNSVPAFRLRVRGEELLRLDRTDPSFTTMKPGAECFQIVTMPWEEDVDAFCAHARERCESQEGFLCQESENDALIYYSCLPWLDFTALSNERSFDRDDTIPRLTWGRYHEEGGRLFLHLSADVNHRTIDGVHIGRLKEAIDREIAALR